MLTIGNSLISTDFLNSIKIHQNLDSLLLLPDYQFSRCLKLPLNFINKLSLTIKKSFDLCGVESAWPVQNNSKIIENLIKLNSKNKNYLKILLSSLLYIPTYSIINWKLSWERSLILDLEVVICLHRDN